MDLEAKTDAGWRKYAADTVASQSWGLSVGTLTEIASGWTAGQIVKSRLMMIGMNLVTGRPYGMWRDFVLEKAGVTKETGPVARYLLNGLATASFYTSLYVGMNGVINDIGSEGLIKGGTAGFAMGLFMGGPYGLWMDYVRSRMGVPSELKRE